MNNISYYILSALAVLIILTLHEFAHGYTAYKLGDNTARSMGRLTLNPLAHLDPFGALCLVLFHFGWAKPVPINPRNFKNPKRDFALTALAGPLFNIILAFISAFLYLVMLSIFSKISFASKFLYQIALNTLKFIFIFHSINIGLGIFNLIPVPPLDGSRILNVVLPPKIYFGIMRHERKIYWVLISWLLLGTYVYRAALSIPFVSASPVLSAIARFFSLSDILGDLFSLISGAMLDFWRLIPFLNI
jgi:Zn-dependent protease